MEGPVAGLPRPGSRCGSKPPTSTRPASTKSRVEILGQLESARAFSRLRHGSVEDLSHLAHQRIEREGLLDERRAGLEHLTVAQRIVRLALIRRSPLRSGRSASSRCDAAPGPPICGITTSATSRSIRPSARAATSSAFEAVGRREHVIAMTREPFADQIAHAFFILDQQHRFSAARHREPAARGALPTARVP